MDYLQRSLQQERTNRGLFRGMRNIDSVIAAPARKRILAVLPYSPNRIRIRTFETLQELTRRAEVDVVCLDDGGPLDFPTGVRKRHVVPNSSPTARISRILLGLLRGRPITHEFYGSRHLRHILAELDLMEYDALYVERLPIYRYVNHPRIIYDCCDCCSRLNRLMAIRGHGYKRLVYALDALLLPRHERAACNAASLVLISAKREATELRRLGVTSPIEIWTPYEHASAIIPRRLCERERFVVSFHGKMSYAANELALAVLNDVIAPKLDKSRYDLRVIGKCSKRHRKKFSNLNFIGFVPSILDSVRDSDLSVFPLLVSVGIPNKAIESLAAGVPFIATPDVVDGLPKLPEAIEEGIYVRSLREFPAEIERYSRLSLSRRQQISERCCQYADKIHDVLSRQTPWEWIQGEPCSVADVASSVQV
jgi:glycosyltransferase involved in cell wall biosynthesis